MDIKELAVEFSYFPDTLSQKPQVQTAVPAFVNVWSIFLVLSQSGYP